MLEFLRVYGRIEFTLGRRQVVRQRVLVPSFAGSIPADPAIFYSMVMVEAGVRGANLIPNGSQVYLSQLKL